MPLQLHKTWSLAEDALDIERRLRCKMPDCIHLALAMREDAVYVTGDRDLYRSVQDSALAFNIEWIGNLGAYPPGPLFQ
jgi:predicted nucleic acid-binding protein